MGEIVGIDGSPDAWIDLSTGINPHPYPVPAIAADAWHHLPEAHPGLIVAAVHYTTTRLRCCQWSGHKPRSRRCRVCARHVAFVVTAPSYAEHAHCWGRAGHAAYAELATALADYDVMVVCNPNNPTGATVAPAVLLAWVGQLAARGGWLIVDEAFADTTPAISVAGWTAQPSLIILRSVEIFRVSWCAIGLCRRRTGTFIQTGRLSRAVVGQRPGTGNWLSRAVRPSLATNHARTIARSRAASARAAGAKRYR